MRKFTLRLSVLFLFAIIFQVASGQSNSRIPRPKLVVGIAVDQMRWDYLYRYYERYDNNGFRRMLNEGFSCDNTFISHLPSYTAVGHSTIFTGSVPAIHGITGNNWIDQVTGRRWYCVEDTTVNTVGSSTDKGKMSPSNLLSTTVTDELKLATNFRSRVVGVSIKDRASVLPAGHVANAAFWYDDKEGVFITSDYYMKELPDWLKKFNAADLPGKLLANDWNTLYPINTYSQSTADDVSWEGTFEDEQKPVFPHHVAEEYRKNKGALSSTPFGNTVTLDLARAAVEGYNLGGSGFTDFLTINLASTDYVGHRYGPNSIEVEDTYLRLDKDLGSFFSFLDKRVGKGNYTVFLSADHGGAHSINFMKENKLPAGFLQSPLAPLKEFLKSEYGDETLVQDAMNYHFSMNRKRIKELRLNADEVKKNVVRFLQTLPGIEFAADIENIGSSNIPEPIRTMIANGYNPKRTGEIIIIQDPGWFSSNGKGTTHGAWNPYDTHIPLIFMGWGIPRGHSSATYQQTDIAPTISALLHIQMPSGSVGKVITEVVK